MANERQATASTAVASFRSDAFPDFHLYRYYCCFDNNTLSIIERLRSAPRLRSAAFLDDFFSRYCGDDVRVVVDDQSVTIVQLLVTAAIIIAVTVCDMRTRTLSSFVPFSIYDIKVEKMKEISVKKYKEIIQAIYNNSRWWSAFSLDQLLYNQQIEQQQQQQVDVVFVQCNQHHRESHHRGSTHFNTFYKTIAFDNNQLLSVVDFHFTVDTIRIVQNKKILIESIIFAYLISLNLYS